MKKSIYEPIREGYLPKGMISSAEAHLLREDPEDKQICPFCKEMFYSRMAILIHSLPKNKLCPMLPVPSSETT